MNRCMKRCVKRCMKRCMKRCVKRCVNRCVICFIFSRKCVSRCVNRCMDFFFPAFSTVLSRFEYGNRGENSMHHSCTYSCTWGKKSCTHSCTLSCTREKVQIREFMHLFMRRSNFQIRKSQSGIHTGFTARDKSRDVWTNRARLLTGSQPENSRTANRELVREVLVSLENAHLGRHT